MNRAKKLGLGRQPVFGQFSPPKFGSFSDKAQKIRIIKRHLTKTQKMQEEEKQEVKVVRAKISNNQGFRPIKKRKNKMVSFQFLNFFLDATFERKIRD